MLFHTWEFAVFFAIAFGGHLLLKRTRFMNHWLLACSYVFYGWWNWLFLGLILFTTSIDYAVARGMAGKSLSIRRWLLSISLVTNLGLLGFFKYSKFFAETLNQLVAFTGIHLSVPVPHLLLPVGISFFTFQSLSYTIDVYREWIPAERNFIKFAAFVALFPQLVAGPIVRASHLLPQLASEPRIGKQNILDGIPLFVAGLFKKVALADYLALYVDRVFASPENQGSVALLCAAWAFTFQIYFDFSGYTDMARGVARMMGFDLILNFNNPYAAVSPRDFWQRWHISLSQWFRDYVYVPLGGNRFGKGRAYFNVILTMLLSGLWHGAAWTFLVWGGLHAAARAIQGLCGDAPFFDRIPRIVKQLLMAHFACLCWIFFRAGSVHEATMILQRIFSRIPGQETVPVALVCVMTIAWLWQLASTSRVRSIMEQPWYRGAALGSMVLYLVLFASSTGGQFIYFQF